MSLSEFLDKFRLDSRFIERDREISRGLAQAHERAATDLKEDDGRWLIQMMMSATEYRRAGAHSILLSDRKMSAEMFDLAGRTYARMRRPYSLMMFACATGIDNDSDSLLGQSVSVDDIEWTQLPYAVLTQATVEKQPRQKEMRAARARLVGSQTSPVGVLGIPIGAYLDLAHVLESPEPPLRGLDEALLPFLGPYSIALRRCMQDEFHWQMMAFPFHPAEPDVLSVLFCVETALRRRQRGSVLAVLERMPLFSVAMTIISNAVQERFGPAELH
jgi:hypothetical protein